MKLLDLFEKFVDEPPQVGDQTARLGSFKRNSDAPYSPVEALDKAGWRYIGGGAFSQVFKNPKLPGKVLKVIENKDIGWTRFYSMAKRSDNEHYPEVSRMGILDLDGQPHYAVLMEELIPSHRIPGRDSEDLVKGINRYYRNGDADLLNELIEARGWTRLMEVVDAIKSLFQNTRIYYVPDIKTDNIMWRGRIPVFTDPIVGVQR